MKLLFLQNFCFLLWNGCLVFTTTGSIMLAYRLQTFESTQLFYETKMFIERGCWQTELASNLHANTAVNLDELIVCVPELGALCVVPHCGTVIDGINRTSIIMSHWALNWDEVRTVINRLPSIYSFATLILQPSCPWWHGASTSQLPYPSWCGALKSMSMLTGFFNRHVLGDVMLLPVNLMSTVTGLFNFLVHDNFISWLH